MRRGCIQAVFTAALLGSGGFAHGATAPDHGPTSVGAPHSKAELATAFRAAFGKPPPVTIGAQDAQMTFTPAGLVDLDPSAGILALVAEGQNKDDCHACVGSLSLTYLKRTPTGFQRTGKTGRDKFDGDGFGAPPQWKVRRDLEANPVLTVETGFTGQGYTCASQALVELTPDGAKIRAESVPVDYDDSGVGHGRVTTLEGQIRPLARGRSFEVVFHGTRSMRMVYERHGETYATRDRMPPSC
jgi:hypothetical protein